MATLRLPFLYPFLLSPVKAGSRNAIADGARSVSQRRPQHRSSSTSVESRTLPPISILPVIPSNTSSTATTEKVAPAKKRSTKSTQLSPDHNAATLSSTPSAGTRPNPRKKRLITSEVHTRSRSPPRAGFNTSATRAQPELASQRYGTANEPPPMTIPVERQLPYKEAIPAQPRLPEPTKALPVETKDNIIDEDKQNPSLELAVIKPTPGPAGTPTGMSDSPRASGGGPQEGAAQQNQTALSTILRMESDGGDVKPPHLTPPPYVHHFDTFTVVSELEQGGFTNDQAETIMKLMRVVLTENVELARDGILGKADAEMSAYLFRAACSELRHEIRNNRQTITERMRSERTQLQHEVDILAQRISQDTVSLKDDIRGMFDDRKMTVRIERRDVENAIQELNYRITTRLQSELRSEVEALRWALVRRTALAVASVVMTAFLALRFNQWRKAREQKALARRKEDEEAARLSGFVPLDVENAEKPSLVSRGVQTGDDVNPELVSLG